ncbi:MAG: hypothetical protein AUJ72_03490 [Candidatus Omnitrophica bacterium CG1_02_46_14]|nr:MAG: hypothetical protein AUJ72_03490 [Candidatus Omnitrophica bacterium CG1_02_46_14]
MKNFQKKQFFLWNLLICFGMILSSLSFVNAAEQEMHNAHGKRDPFVPLVTTTMKSSSSGLLGIENIDELSIEGVVYDPGHGSVVIVNGAILKEGEELGSVKVLKISPEGARFLVNGAEGFKPIYQEESANKKNVKK